MSNVNGSIGGLANAATQGVSPPLEPSVPLRGREL
jgi:hypothetical protein